MNNLLIEIAPHLGVHPHFGPDLEATLRQVLSETLARLRVNSGTNSVPVPQGRTSAARPPVRLSQREREVLQRIAAGDSNKVIARTFDLSLHTVKRHVANILDKLGASSRGQAAAWWNAQA
ncbi:MAG: helix-turn-helix transcriptional regulator [Burkholderiales bacterium]